MGSTTNAALTFTDVTFTYAGAATPALHGVTLTVPAASLALLVGGTGAGKSTLLRLAAPAVAPAGNLAGIVSVFGHDTATLPDAGVRDVGLVLQDTDAQIVCDDVRSEMAFGLENLGLSRAEMGRRIAEAATFFGMASWFGRRTDELSGGQRQVLALAAALAMRPRLLLLDEPVAQLDPITAAAFASLVGRANRELGITVVVATHAPAPFVPHATCAFEMSAGRVRSVGVDACCRLTTPASAPATTGIVDSPVDHRVRPSVATARDLWFRHARDDAWVLAGLDIDLRPGEVHVLLGGNGVGKTTLLRIVAGLVRPQRGRVVNDRARSMGYLPQGVGALIGRDSVRDELMAWAPGVGYDEREARARLADLALDVDDGLLDRHPHDLSGGQQRLLALAKVLLTRPGLLLLDEPTAGLDPAAVFAVACALRAAADADAAVFVATHDVAFARSVATTVSLLFDGRVVASEPAGAFFADAWLWGA